MLPVPRSSPLGCVIAVLSFMLLSATVMAGVAAWLAYLRPEKNIEWPPLAWLAAGLLAVTILVFSVAWHRAKNSGDS